MSKDEKEIFNEGLQIVYLRPEELTPYEKNARKHGVEDIDGIKKSILDTGFNDPIGIWGDNNLIVEGHGRQLAALELHLDKVPCIRLDHLTETQRKEYAIRHNRTAELSSWDFDVLAEELADLDIQGVDMGDLNFDVSVDDVDAVEKEEAEKYTSKVDIPHYEPSGEKPDIEELVNLDKVYELLNEIKKSNVSKEEKEFLKVAAYRHARIDFDLVADYYAHSDPEMQKLMEHSALVIIDLEDAIAGGFARLNIDLDELMEADKDEG